MLNDELSNVLEFIKTRGAVYESEVWKHFVKSESKHEQVRVKWIIQDLDMKGLIQVGYNKAGELIVRYPQKYQ